MNIEIEKEAKHHLKRKLPEPKNTKREYSRIINLDNQEIRFNKINNLLFLDNLIEGFYISQTLTSIPIIDNIYYCYMDTNNKIDNIYQQFQYIINQKLKRSIIFKQLLGGQLLYYFLIHISFYLSLYFTSNYQTQSHFILQLLAFGIFINYAISILIIPSNFHPSNETIETNVKYCEVCDLFQIERMKHCNICQRCIYRWDTHSILLNSCLGQHNFPFFFHFILLTTIYLAYLLYLIQQDIRIKNKYFINFILFKHFLYFLTILLQLTIRVFIYSIYTFKDFIQYYHLITNQGLGFQKLIQKSLRQGNLQKHY